MSKRKRKNAGLGYGYQFHGSFKEKKDAVAKERKTKGAWIKSTLTNAGYRHIVMSPRTNPIKRKKKAKPEVSAYSPRSAYAPRPGANPSELIVMGANPHENVQEIVLQPGAKLVIRNNPADAVCGARIGGEICTRKPGHRGPHLPQGATMRTRQRLPKTWRPNPSAEALREKFTGREVGRVKVHEEPHMPAGDYAMLGKGLALYVKPRIGGQVQVIDLHGVMVVSDESARQIYFVGGDQDVSTGLDLFGAIDRGPTLLELGEARRIDYKQRKEHVPHPEMEDWRHDFGEENGSRPLVLFDVVNKRLLLEGGDYTVRAEGIVN
jgi:hypothetical protein